MIKLENPVNAPVAFGVLTVQGAGDQPAVVLSVQAVRKPPAPGSKDWTDDPTRLKQILSYIGSDGQPVELEGVVPEAQAISISGAFKVVVEVLPSNKLQRAYEAGKVSREDAVLELSKVLEVWSTASKCIYGPQSGQSGRPVKTLDASGRITAAA